MTLTDSDLHDFAGLGIIAARKAASHIQEWVGEHREVYSKEGSGSLASQVVTEVDLACQGIILEEIKETIADSKIGLLTEESEDDSSRLRCEYFWCIDPLDGTLPFIEGIPGYSVSIALVNRSGESLLGLVVDPHTGDEFQAIRGNGLKLNSRPFTSTARPCQKKLHWMMNRSMKTHPRYGEIDDRIKHLANELGYMSVEKFSTSGGVIHACRVLQEAPAIYFTLPKTGTGGGSIWDYAATACLFEEAGVPVTTPRGDRLHLNHPETTFMSHCGVLYASSLDLRESVSQVCSHFLP